MEQLADVALTIDLIGKKVEIPLFSWVLNKYLIFLQVV
jgi:hypothetical protein